MNVLVEGEVPYLSPEKYVEEYGKMRGAVRLHGLRTGDWPVDPPSLEFQKLVVLTTPGERLEGIRTAAWPFGWEDMLRRIPAEVVGMREIESGQKRMRGDYMLLEPSWNNEEAYFLSPPDDWGSGRYQRLDEAHRLLFPGR